MSASNWGVCPECINKSVRIKELFVKKYYGVLDPFIYGKMLGEIENALESIKGYSESEHHPNKEILELMKERKIEVEGENWKYDPSEILWNGHISNCLREDYEQGVDSRNSCVFMRYSCACENCGFSKTFIFNEEMHTIILTDTMKELQVEK